MFGVNDKKMKLEQAKLQLDELQKNTSHIEARNRDIKADFEKTAISYEQQIINKIWAQAGMKALAEIADIYPRMTSIHDSSLFDDSFAMDFINHGDKIIYSAMYLPGKKLLPGFLSVRLIDDGYLLQQFRKLEKLHAVAALDEDVVVVRLCFLDGCLYLFYIMELAVLARDILELVTYQPDILQAGSL